MKKLLLILALAVLLPYGPARAGLREGGFVLQFSAGLSTSIKPAFSMMPTMSARSWFNVADKFMVGAEISAFSSQITQFDSAKAGWGGATFLKLRSFDFGKEACFHVLAKGGFQSEAGSWKMEFNAAQYEVGLYFPIEPWARSVGQKKGVAFEPGVSWMMADGLLSQIGVSAKGVLDF